MSWFLDLCHILAIFSPSFMETDGLVWAFTHPVIYCVYTKWSATHCGHPIFGQPKCQHLESMNKMCEKRSLNSVLTLTRFPYKRKRGRSECAPCLRCGSVYFRHVCESSNYGVWAKSTNRHSGVRNGAKASRWTTCLKEVFLGEKTKTAGNSNRITSIKTFSRVSGQTWSNPHTAPLYA